MSSARLKRLAKLESRQVRVFVPFDYAAAAAALRWLIDCYAAVVSGKASAIPFHGPHPAPSSAKATALAGLASTAKRLKEARSAPSLGGA